MSIADIRDAFNAATAAKGIRCDRALLMYCDDSGNAGAEKRTHQMLVFNCTNGKQYTTIVPPGQNINVAAMAYGQKVVENAGI